MDCNALLSLYFERDESAILETQASFGALCRSIISNILKDKRDVEECMNSVWLKLWNSIPPAEPHDFKAYIAKTARNEALMRIRGNSRRPIEEELKEELVSFLPPVENDAEAMELAEAIGRYLNKQSKEKRYVFMRRYWYFDSIKEIIKRTGMSRSKITGMLFRMRNDLRKVLEKEELL